MAETTKESPKLGTSIVGTSSVKSHAEAKYLIIVPGHAVYMGKEAAHANLDEHWKGGFKGEAVYYTQHALAGVEEARRDKSILLFSGGLTRESTIYSEGQSYWELANQHNWLDNQDLRKRAAPEIFARDSFENLAFGVGKFTYMAGEKPQLIVICGWTFKEERYRMHADALGIRQENLYYIGVNNPEGDALTGALKGEVKAVADFNTTPLGNEGILAEKRALRDPFFIGDAYAAYHLYELFPVLRVNL
jgi:hypothetical protein